MGFRLSTVTVTEVSSDPPKPSSTVRLNPYVPSSVATKAAVAVSASVRVTFGPPTCLHAYVNGSPSSSTLAVPSKTTICPRTIGGPVAVATAVGARLTTVTSTVSHEVLARKRFAQTLQYEPSHCSHTI